jgi:predicted transcriptional regulator
MGSQETEIPYRYITRCLVEFQLDSLRLALSVFPGELHRAIIFVLVARMSCADWVQDDQIKRPLNHSPFSVNSLASSLNRPFETIRRHILAMIDAGICVKTLDGIILSPSADREGAIIQHFADQAALLNRLALKIADHDVAISRPDQPSDNQLRLQVTAALDLGLIALENNEHQSWYELIIHGALIHESGIDFVSNNQLAREYANRIIPDNLWQPVKIRAISEKYGMPYPTMRRHFLAMQAEGFLHKKASGYVLSTKWTADEERIAMSDRNVQYLLRHLRTLASSGIDLLESAAALAA